MTLDGFLQHIDDLVGVEGGSVGHEFQEAVVAEEFLLLVLCLVQTIGVYKQPVTADIVDGLAVEGEELSLITNKFYRGKQWKESKESGSGLGLYIAKTLMEKMDGELLAESAGEGLSISLIIPLS